MDLTTQCPQCGTEFEVSLQQLQLRKGYIRCVNCAHIFDAYEAVVPATGSDHRVSATPTQDEHLDEPQFSTSGSSVRKSSAEPEFIVSPPDEKAPIPIRKRHPSEAAAFTVRDPDDITETQRHTIGPADSGPSYTASDGASGLYIEPRSSGYSPNEYEDADTPTGLGIGGVLLSVLIVVGVGVALLQAAYIYRVQIASEIPALRPALERYCQVLNCTVDYPRRLSQIAVMDSSLQEVRNETEPSADAQGQDDSTVRMVLEVVLRNNFERPQQWPSMSLELVDFSGVVAARRSLAPADYLPELSLERPFPAKSEVRVSVPIVVEDMRINGYQLDTFFP